MQACGGPVAYPSPRSLCTSSFYFFFPSGLNFLCVPHDTLSLQRQAAYLHEWLCNLHENGEDKEQGVSSIAEHMVLAGVDWAWFIWHTLSHLLNKFWHLFVALNPALTRMGPSCASPEARAPFLSLLLFTWRCVVEDIPVLWRSDIIHARFDIPSTYGNISLNAFGRQSLRNHPCSSGLLTRSRR